MELSELQTIFKKPLARPAKGGGHVRQVEFIPIYRDHDRNVPQREINKKRNSAYFAPASRDKLCFARDKIIKKLLALTASLRETKKPLPALA